MKNQHLAEMIIKQADTFPESFRMDQWGAETACGTVACIAGHAMLQCGYRLTGITKTDWTGVQYRAFLFTDDDGTPVANYGNEAQRLLGMSDDERYDKTIEGLPCGDIFIDINSGLQRFRELTEEGKKK